MHTEILSILIKSKNPLPRGGAKGLQFLIESVLKTVHYKEIEEINFLWKEKPSWIDQDKLDLTKWNMRHTGGKFPEQFWIGEGFLLRDVGDRTRSGMQGFRVSFGFEFYFTVDPPSDYEICPSLEDYNRDMEFKIRHAKAELEHKLEQWIFKKWSKGQLLHLKGQPLILQVTPQVPKGMPILFVHPEEWELLAESLTELMRWIP